MASIARQTYPHIEHIVVDGGSVDATLSIVEYFAEEAYATIISEPDEGLYDALNKGICTAKGDIVGILHSDDVFAHDRVIDVVVKAFEDPDINAVYGDLDYISSYRPERVVRRWKSEEFQQHKLAQGWMPPHPTLFLRRSVFERLGAYNPSFQIAADYDAILRFFGHDEITSKYVPDVFVNMSLGGESNASLENIILKSREDYRALRSNNVGGLATLMRKNVSKLNQFF